MWGVNVDREEKRSKDWALVPLAFGGFYDEDSIAEETEKQQPVHGEPRGSGSQKPSEKVFEEGGNDLLVSSLLMG